MLMCPVCEAGLRTIKRHGVEVDYCNHCRGIWLDCHELDEIVIRAKETNQNSSTRRASHPNTLHNLARRNYRGAWRESWWNDEPGRLDGGELSEDDDRCTQDDRYYNDLLHRNHARRDAFDSG